MSAVTPEELIAVARTIVGHFACSEDASAGGVAAALVTRSGHVYSGICIDTMCSLGHCAESSAISEMLKARETEIACIVAINGEGKIFPPCGRCRELIRQVSPANWETEVIVGHGRIARLSALMPFGEPAAAAPLSVTTP